MKKTIKAWFEKRARKEQERACLIELDALLAARREARQMGAEFSRTLAKREDVLMQKLRDLR
jgi:hypothetical protein